MTANRRIALNIIATYGRSLYALVIGLFTARWALQALGQVDYGLIGLIVELIELLIQAALLLLCFKVYESLYI